MSDMRVVEESDVLLVQGVTQIEVVDSESESVLTVDAYGSSDFIDSESESVIAGETPVDPDIIDANSDFQVITVGEQGPPGVQGPIGEDKNYTHYQGLASSTWTITHNLAKRPAVTVVDSAGDEVEGGLQYLSENVLILTFSAAFSGTAYLN